MPKILEPIASCKVCPHRQYDGGDRYDCGLVGEQIINDSHVAPFCPLADFPSNQIARLERTIQSLQQSNDFGFHFAIMSFVVKKTGATMSADGRYIILVEKDGGPIYLLIELIAEIDLKNGHIIFLTENGERYAFVTSTPPRLLREKLYQIGNEDKRGWQEVFFRAT